jgi:hypothetical protein
MRIREIQNHETPVFSGLRERWNEHCSEGARELILPFLGRPSHLLIRQKLAAVDTSAFPNKNARDC